MTRIILVRHGETEWNRVERFRVAPMCHSMKEACSKPKRQHGASNCACPRRQVYSSPLSRATRTAHAIAGKQSLSVKVHQGLVDIDYGEWQGLSAEEVTQRWPELLAAWFQAPHTCEFPEGNRSMS